MAERKIIFKARVGSYLYGTNRPDSDEDFLGVFLPSTDDLLGLQECPREFKENKKISQGEKNTKGDIDCKYFSLKEFLKMAAEGQSIALELFFIPPEHIIISTPEWLNVLKHKDIIFSRQGISPFIGFALGQAHKSVVKGENLNLITNLINYSAILTSQQLNEPLSNLFIYDTEGQTCFIDIMSGLKVAVYRNDHGAEVVDIAGRKYDIHLKTKTFINNLKELRGKYGKRSEAAAEDGYDYKSLLHAYRLLGEAQEFLLDKKITFPRPNAPFLKSIRAKEYYANYFDEITQEIDILRQKIEPMSTLPEHPNRKKIDKLHKQMIFLHLRGSVICDVQNAIVAAAMIIKQKLNTVRKKILVMLLR